MTPQELARQLTATRKENKITQQEVADYIGCHISQVQSIEYRPEINRKVQTYINYAEAIGCELEFFLKPLGT